MTLKQAVYEITMTLYPPGVTRLKVRESLEILEEVFEMRSISAKHAKALGAASVELALSTYISMQHFMFESRIEEALHQLSKVSPEGYHSAVAEIDGDS